MPELGLLKGAIGGILILMVFAGLAALIVGYWYYLIGIAAAGAGVVYVMQQRKRNANRV